MTLTALGAAAALLWCALLALPWRPWRADVRFDAPPDSVKARLDDVTVLIPARNEAHTLPQALAALRNQGAGLEIVVVDDLSTDATARIARAAGAIVVSGEPVPSGWSGKVWALEQGLRRARREWLLLLDADIELAPGCVSALRAHASREALDFASIVPAPRLETAWEKLLMPAFIYFFSLLYPFRLSNAPGAQTAAASGGCVLARRAALETIGGFTVLRGALIDDCSLAACVKRAGFRTWIGLTHAARGLRPYGGLSAIWAMVERTAYTELRYSPARLIACTVLMAIAYLVPVAAVAYGDPSARAAGVLAAAAMMASYLPTLRFYRRSPAWAALLPLIGALYLGMTWSSALRYHRGERARWRGRVYEVSS